MDNFRIDVTGQGEHQLRLALEIAFTQHKRAVAFRDTPEQGLVFYVSAAPGATPLPFAVDAESALGMVSNWLDAQRYGPKPDHDGHNKKGWRVHNGPHGYIGGERHAFLAVQPVWARYGK